MIVSSEGLMKVKIFSELSVTEWESVGYLPRPLSFKS